MMMNMSDLVAKVAEERSLTTKDARAAVDAVFSAIEESLVSGDSVRTSFGTFSIGRPARP
jgi:DNA-binding protein HU-beta